MLYRRSHAQSSEYKPGHTGYVSEFTQFMDKFLQDHPEVEKDQRIGWDIFWDHQVDPIELDRLGRDTVPVKGYDYF